MSSHFGYYRQPAIHGDRIAFISEDDLWVASASGGVARRLTSNRGSISFPAFSPDGEWLAYTGRDDGPTEIYVMESDGGTPQRVTWLGGATQVAGWSPDGKSIIAATDWRQPFARLPHLVSIPVDGSPVRSLGWGPARNVSFEPDGKGTVIGRNANDPARWKRYRGGTAGTLWIDRQGDGDFRQLVKLEGNLANPMWIDNRIYFLSDHEGHGNLYSCTPTGRSLTRHTHHEDFYARFPSTDGQRIIYHAGADLFIYDPNYDETEALEIRIRSSRNQTTRKFVSASRSLESYSLHPEGHSVSTVNRGGLFTMPLWEGAPRRYGAVSRTRYRLSAYLPDGKSIIAIDDEDGEESIVVFSTDGSTRPKRIRGDFGRPFELAVAPGDAMAQRHGVSNGPPASASKKKTKKKPARRSAQSGGGPKLAALANERHEVLLVDLSTGMITVVDHSPFNRVEGIAWSPDSRWLAYSYYRSARTSLIRVYDVRTKKSHDVTDTDFRDTDPCFSSDGKYLYFLSWRTFDPIYDAQYFDLGFPRGCRPHLVTLTADTPSPFDKANRKPQAPSALSRDIERIEARRRGNGIPEVKIDFEGIAERLVPFPVPEGRYGKILASRDRALFSSFPIEGSLGDTWAAQGEPPAKGRLQCYDFDQHKVEAVTDSITDFSVSLDQQVLAIRRGNRLRVVGANFKEHPSQPKKADVSRESGWIDVDRIRLAVIPHDEWEQMFAEAWRMQRDHFWTETMSGIDWPEVYERYQPLVARCGVRSEFSDLVWEMQGELGTSHCYELGGDYRPTPSWFQGQLGADLEFNRRTGEWVVRRIPRGDSWDSKYNSPLAAPGVNVREGDTILEVGGEPVGPDVSPYERLVNSAGREVELTIGSTTGGTSRSKTSKRRVRRRQVVVKTLPDETQLRYRDWVERNRARVHRETRGKVGYVHVPNMGPLGFSEFHRYYSMEVEHDGLIVDVRHNGGGHVSQLLSGKTDAQTDRLRRQPMGAARLLSERRARRSDRRVDRRVRRLRRRHVQSCLQALRSRKDSLASAPGAAWSESGRALRSSTAPSPPSPNSRSGSRTSASELRTTEPIPTSRWRSGHRTTPRAKTHNWSGPSARFPRNSSVGRQRSRTSARDRS